MEWLARVTEEDLAHLFIPGMHYSQKMSEMTGRHLLVGFPEQGYKMVLYTLFYEYKKDRVIDRSKEVKKQ